MAWRSHGRTNFELVSALLTNGVIRSAAVQTAMLQVDRGDFVVPEGKGAAYLDQPLPIGWSATISAPHMHAQALELLSSHIARPNARVLDVGSGTGILCAYMAHMMPAGGAIVGVEHIPSLAAASLANLRKSASTRQLLESGAIRIEVGDGYAGWPMGAPYQAIHVGAAAPTLPPALLAQLAPGGRMVIPVGRAVQELLVVDKAADGTLSQHSSACVGLGRWGACGWGAGGGGGRYTRRPSSPPHLTPPHPTPSSFHTITQREA